VIHAGGIMANEAACGDDSCPAVRVDHLRGRAGCSEAVQPRVLGQCFSQATPSLSRSGPLRSIERVSSRALATVATVQGAVLGLGCPGRSRAVLERA
jgi:hypothetical protein